MEVTLHAACQPPKVRSFEGVVSGELTPRWCGGAVFHRPDAGQSLESQSSSAMMTASAVTGGR